MSDDSTKQQSTKFSQTVSWMGNTLVLGFLAYNLFEAYWTGEIFQHERGPHWGWISYRSSPTKFDYMVVVDVIFFYWPAFQWLFLCGAGSLENDRETVTVGDLFPNSPA